MTIPLTDQRLDEIAARAEGVREYIAEIRRQRKATADRAGLRNRIRRAVCEAEGFAWDSDMLEPDEYGEVADMVLAVLPAPADRAAVLHEAATRYEEILANANAGQDPRYWTAVRDITLGLRCMAAEEQPATETPWPSVTDFALEVWEGETWVGITYKRRTLDEVRDRREAYRRRFPDARLRIVRWDERSAVVETDLGPAAGARQAAADDAVEEA